MLALLAELDPKHPRDILHQAILRLQWNPKDIQRLHKCCTSVCGGRGFGLKRDCI